MAPSLGKSSNYRQMNNQSHSLCILVIFLLTNEQGWFLTNLRILEKEHHDSCGKKKKKRISTDKTLKKKKIITKWK